MSDTQLIDEIAFVLTKTFRDQGRGLYSVQRIMGYVLVALAESVDLEGPNDDPTGLSNLLP